MLWDARQCLRWVDGGGKGGGTSLVPLRRVGRMHGNVRGGRVGCWGRGYITIATEKSGQGDCFALDTAPEGLWLVDCLLTLNPAVTGPAALLP